MREPIKARPVEGDTAGPAPARVEAFRDGTKPEPFRAPASVRRLLGLDKERRAAALAQLDVEEQQAAYLALRYDWSLWARPEQLAPEGAWDVFVRLAGRGAGKTRPAAQDVVAWSYEAPLIALMAKDAAMVRDVMLEGESGILSCSPPWWKPRYDRTKLRLTWPNGSQALSLTAEAGADAARGRQFHKAWAEEVVSWPHAREAWHEGLGNAMRLGDAPQINVTSTPKRGRDIIPDICYGPKRADGSRAVDMEAVLLGTKDYVRWSYESVGTEGRVHRTCVSRWRTERNSPNLAPGFAENRRRQYGVSAVASEELDAEILEKIEGSLWTLELIERNRVSGLSCPLVKVVVAVDPTRSDTPVDECGITVGGVGENGHGYALEDLSLRGSPDAWAQVAIAAYHRNRADALVYEKNRMGQMVRDLIRSKDPAVRLAEVNATEGKRVRAEPVSALYEQGRVHHVGTFALLEDEMVSWDPMLRVSPNRMDSLVWLMTYLLLGEQKPRIRLL